jgi:carbon starvation protein CstA
VALVQELSLTDRIFAGAVCAVALATLAFPYVRGEGTLLLQIVVFSAWDLLALLTSQVFADQHRGWVWLVASVVNVFAFCIFALPIWLLTRRRWPLGGARLIAGFAALYLASLFWLFPAAH